MGEEKAKLLENLQAIAHVVFTALGGKKEKARPLQNELEAELAFAAVMGSSGVVGR